MQVSLEKEFFVETPNKPGIAYALTTPIKTAQANLKWFYGEAQSGNKGHFYFIADKPQQVRTALQNTEFAKYQERDVLVARVSDEVGACWQLAEKLQKAGINIEYMQTTSYENHPAIVLSTQDNQKALKVLQ